MDFLDVFGLQVVLEDRTSENVAKIQQSLNSLGVTVQNVEQAVYGSFQRMESIMHSGYQIHLWGQRLMDVGQAVSGSFAKLGQQVLKVGSSFETQRMKLNQLYGDAIQGEKVFQHAVNQALKTPFNVEEYVSAISGLKVSGVDPLKQYMNEKTGEMQDMITFAGDLAGAYGKNMNDAFFSLKEAIAGNDFRSLKHRFDGLSKSVIEASTGMKLSTGGAQKDIEQRAEVFAKFIGSRYGGMMVNLGKTMTGLLSRLKENLQIFFMWVADAGFFSVVKKDLEKLINYIEGNQDKLKQFAKVVSDALTYLIKPLSRFLELGMKAVEMFVDFSNAHPVLARLITVLTVATGSMLVFAGAITMISGSFITMVASLATLALNMRMSHGSTKLTAMLFQGFGKIVMGLSFSLLQFLAVFAIVSTAWKYNIGGLRTSILAFGGDMKEAFKMFKDLVSMVSFDEFEFGVQYLESLNTRTSKLALALSKAFYVIKGVFDYLSDGKVAEDTVKRLDKLGALGFLESFIEFEIAVRSITVGIAKYLVGAFELLKPPINWTIKAVNTLIGLFNKLFNRDTPTLFSDKEGGFKGKLLDGNWETIGFVIGNFIAIGIVTSVAKRIASVVSVINRANQIFLRTSALSMMGHGNFQPPDPNAPTRIGRKRPTVFTMNPFNRQQRRGTMTPQFLPLTWKNLIVAKMGQNYMKFQNSLNKMSKVLTTLKSPFTKATATFMTTKLGRLSQSAWMLATGKQLSNIPRRGANGQFMLSQKGEWNKFKKDLKDFFKKSVPTPTNIRNTTQRIITTTKTQVTNGQNKLQQGKQWGSNLASSLFSGIIGGLSGLLGNSKVAQVIGKGIMWAIGLLPMLLNPYVLAGLFVALLVSVFAGSDIGEAIYNGLFDALEWAIAGLIGASLLLYDWLKVFADWNRKLGRNIKEAFNKFIADSKQALIDFGVALAKKFDELVGIFVQFAIDFQKDPLKAFRNLVSSLVQWGADMGREFAVFTSKMLNAMKDFGEGLMSSFGEGMRRLANPFTTFVDDVKRKTNEIIDYMNKNMGTDIKFKFDVASENSYKSTVGQQKYSEYLDYANLRKKGMSTGGDIRSAGIFQLHEGESVVNDPTMNSFEEGIKRLRTYSNNVNSQNQSQGQTVIYQNTSVDRVEVVLPNVKEASPQDIAEALKDPSVMQALKSVLNKARTQEEMKSGRRVTPNFGVARV